jgi:DNA-binding GntR family transcriptional regulator
VTHPPTPVADRRQRTVQESRLVLPPSLVDVAAGQLRRMIIAGELLPGDRVVENQLTQQLGISRPPLREALRVLEREGLIQSVPRKGAIVTPLTLHDVYEIFTLRKELELLAVRLGIPVRNPERLDRCRARLELMAEAARSGDQATFTECSFEFHVAVIGLSGHQRLEAAYRTLQLQMLLCMTLNHRARADREDLVQNVGRHRRLLALIEVGDRDLILHELTHHGDRTFLDDIESTLDGHTDVALSWLAQVRQDDEGR